MKNASAKLLEQALGEVWNERDEVKRLEAMKRVYAPDVIFYEADDAAEFKGFEAINTRIIELFRGFPPGTAFHFKTGEEINHGVLKKSWTLGVAGQPPLATGMDVAIIENGLIKAFHLFLDSEE
ncbi:MAG: nuclear transport factor 2 family protein [Ginsengibacter sp.]